MMGSGGMIVADEDNDMVEIAKFYLEFTMDESCGKCTPCRIGTKRILKCWKHSLSKKAILKHWKILCCVVLFVKRLFVHWDKRRQPLLSTMKYFPEEYERYARHEVKSLIP